MKDIGAIFDWDGVIIDSHDQHERAWYRMAEELGTEITQQQFKESFGMRNETIMPLFGWAEAGDDVKIAELADRKEHLYRELVREDGIEPLPGVLDLLTQLQDLEVPACVGSSTPTENVECIMDITGLRPYFQDIAAAEDVSEGKPDPEVFLVAAGKIDRQPGRCVVFEDAHVGIEAGLAAGMHVVAVATTHPLESLGDAHVAVGTLAGLDFAGLAGALG